ncbi:hypothetical protein Nepgr_003079 [Nepenthes gracilis]|uniref:Uncharacterized protein n=1 Tax=Nepenthes gracilis TaxID=150966 RepID=A0AAD3RYT9_NEPGR|nr:hypothetical protein Nepgr_003079 [Nepenthes gracilis]
MQMSSFLIQLSESGCRSPLMQLKPSPWPAHHWVVQFAGKQPISDTGQQVDPQESLSTKLDLPVTGKKTCTSLKN